jgi:plastocyanin
MTGLVPVRASAAVRRIGTLVVGMVLAAGVLAGCGGSSSGAAAQSSAPSNLGKVTTGPGGVQQVTLQTQDDYVFTPDHFTVAPGTVKLTVKNVATEMTHNFVFSAGGGPAAISAQIPILAPGQQQTIQFTVQTPGKYRFECSFHVQLGQVGTMTVRG